MSQYIEFFGNHPTLFALLGLALGVIFYTEYRRADSGRYSLSTTDAVRMQNDRHALLLDVRTKDEFNSGHVVGAQHVPLDQLAGALPRLKKFRARPVIVCCQRGAQAGRARTLLRTNEFEETYVLGGGIEAWRRDNLPLVT